MRFRLVPTDDYFFELFNDSASNVAECSRRLRDLLDDFTDTLAKHVRVVEAEQQGDRLTQAILRRLNSSFVTPFDREDIHALAEELDDVADDMLAVSDLLQLVPVTEILPEVREQAGLLVQMVDEVVPLIAKLRDMKDVQPHLDAIDRLESDGDSIYRRTVARLFRDYEAIEVLKWKDIVQAMEAAINTVEDIANVVESIVLKHA
jgi:predicted phosphate transport protein (TIGR00153 family)